MCSWAYLHRDGQNEACLLCLHSTLAGQGPDLGQKSCHPAGCEPTSCASPEQGLLVQAHSSSRAAAQHLPAHPAAWACPLCQLCLEGRDAQSYLKLLSARNQCFGGITAFNRTAFRSASPEKGIQPWKSELTTRVSGGCSTAIRPHMLWDCPCTRHIGGVNKWEVTPAVTFLPSFTQVPVGACLGPILPFPAAQDSHNHHFSYTGNIKPQSLCADTGISAQPLSWAQCHAHIHWHAWR